MGTFLVIMFMLSKKALIGYPAGVITGVTYGLNPLFAIPLLQAGAAVESVLLFRYGVAAALLGLFLALMRRRMSVTLRQSAVLLVLGLLFSCSSLFLFLSYRYIPSGLATTVVFLYPVLVALIMACLGKTPSLPVWIAVGATFAGVAIMTGGGDAEFDIVGIALAVLSALSYAFFIVIINRSRTIATVDDTVLTFYSLLTGTVVFGFCAACSGTSILSGLEDMGAWGNLIGLAILPTIVSTATLAIATRNIGPTKASVLGVFEPVTAILVGTLAFGEPLTTPIVVGILLSMAAVTFMVVSTSR